MTADTPTPEQVTMRVLDYRTAQLAALGPAFAEEVNTLRQAAAIMENYVDVKAPTPDAPDTRADLDALLVELDTTAWFADGKRGDELVALADFTRHRIAKALRDAAAALAAERDRADRAEARVADAWDQGHTAPTDSGHWENDRPRKGMRTWVEDLTPNPYRSEATA